MIDRVLLSVARASRFAHYASSTRPMGRGGSCSIILWAEGCVAHEIFMQPFHFEALGHQRHADDVLSCRRARTRDVVEVDRAAFLHTVRAGGAQSVHGAHTRDGKGDHRRRGPRGDVTRQPARRLIRKPRPVRSVSKPQVGAHGGRTQCVSGENSKLRHPTMDKFPDFGPAPHGPTRLEMHFPPGTTVLTMNAMGKLSRPHPFSKSWLAVPVAGASSTRRYLAYSLSACSRESNST